VPSKKTFILRTEASTYHALEKWASDEFRSVNGQLEWLRDKALKDAGRKKDKATKSKQDNKKQVVLSKK
jgi:hypothetical protein